MKDLLARLDGVGDVQIFGAGEYSMRVWLDPQKLAQRNMTTGDIVHAIQEQNVAVAAGALNAPPVPGNTDFQLNINTQGRLGTVDDFRNIIVRTDANGSVVHLRDVARVELGSNQYALRSLLNNQPAVAIPIFARPGSNAIQISNEVRATMAELKKEFPQGVDYSIVYDPTVFVRGSIEAVAHTLLEAILLVVLVVILFLQTWRASIIPLVSVPVSLIGTFAVMYVVGFSLKRAVAIRSGAGDRHRGGRCDRGGGKRRAQYRAWLFATRGDTPCDERGDQPDRCDGVGVVCSVHSDRFHQRPDRRVLSPIRADDCRSPLSSPPSIR